MKTWWVWVGVAVGLLALLALAAGVAGGRDHTDEIVRADRWADDVCGAVAAWEGQLEAIGDDLTLSNVGARPNDGGSGDSVEGTVYVRTTVDRAIQATQDTLQEGLKRAGIPETAQGPQASLVLRTWAQLTEDDLNVVRNAFDRRPNTTSAAFAMLGAAVGALERSAVRGRAAFAQVAGLDADLAGALDDSRDCQRLVEEQP